MGSDYHAICDQGRERQFSGVRIERPLASAVRELLGVLQHLLRARPVGLDLLALWDTQWTLVRSHHSLLAPSILSGDDVFVHRSRITWWVCFVSGCFVFLENLEKKTREKFDLCFYRFSEQPNGSVSFVRNGGNFELKFWVISVIHYVSNWTRFFQL